MRGIYKITNKINNKIYIGESLDIKRRWEEHINDLNNNNHHSYKLQNDWNTYGKDNFNFQVISMLDDSISNFIDKYILLIYESKYIEEYNSIYEGYNIEKTINKVINKKKIIMDAYKDPIMISGYIEKVNNGEFKEIDGIIYKETFIMHDILKCFDISYSKLKMLLIKNNILVAGDSNKVNSYILNEKVFNKEDIIINNGNYSKLKFSRKIYLSIIEIINKFMEEK